MMSICKAIHLSCNSFMFMQTGEVEINRSENSGQSSHVTGCFSPKFVHLFNLLGRLLTDRGKGSEICHQEGWTL